MTRRPWNACAAGASCWHPRIFGIYSSSRREVSRNEVSRNEVSRGLGSHRGATGATTAAGLASGEPTALWLSWRGYWARGASIIKWPVGIHTFLNRRAAQTLFRLEEKLACAARWPWPPGRLRLNCCWSGITSTFCGLIYGLITPFLCVGAPKAEGVPAEGFPVLPLVASLEFSAFRVVSSSDWHQTTVVSASLFVSGLGWKRHSAAACWTELFPFGHLFLWLMWLERLHSAPLPRRPSFTAFGTTACPPSMHSRGPHYRSLELVWK